MIHSSSTFEFENQDTGHTEEYLYGYVSNLSLIAF
jgi:hypothetical protein